MKKPIPFGKYYLMDRIAVGGMAEVFKGKMFGVESFERTVALKRILPNIAEDQDFITMFIDEAKIAVQLSHPNIAQIYELGEEGGAYFIAMEYVQGRDLRTIFERCRRQKTPPVSPQMAAYVMSKACEGLDYAHRKRDKNDQPLSIVHRDVSPQNILVSYDGDVKVIDFGVAKAQSKSTRTQAGILKGKFGYMSPEQVQGLPLDQRSDIFSIGIVLHEILTGQRLFVGESDFHTLEKIRRAEAAPPSRFNHQVPQQLDAIVMKALSRDLHTRYQYASEMQEDLQRFLYGTSPVFSRRNLAQYMENAYGADITKERQRGAEYDRFFESMSHQPPPQMAQTPTGAHWSGAPIEQQPSSGSFGSHPGGAYAPSSVSAPAPAYAAPQPSFVGHLPQTGAPQAYYQSSEDLNDPTMLGGDHMQGERNMALTGSPFSPSDISGSGAPPPPSNAQEAFEEDDGAETIIDQSFNEELDEERKSSSKKGLIITVVSALLVCLVGGGIGVYIYLDSLKPPPPTEPEPAQITLNFMKSIEKTKFFLNEKELLPNQLKKLGPKRVVIKIKNPGKGTLRIEKKGFKTFQRRFRIAEGGGLIQSMRLVPMWAYFKVAGKPEDASVIINGIVQKKKAPGRFRVVAGEKHTIEITKPKYTLWKKVIKLTSKSKESYDYKLKRTRATLLVQCKHNPKADIAKVYLNRSRRGRTPKKIRYLRYNRAYKIRVVPNDYKKTFEKEVTFTLRPTKILKVDCVKPVVKVGVLTIKSAVPARLYLNGKSHGMVDKMDKGMYKKAYRLKPGKYAIELQDPKTQKKIGPYSYKIRAKYNTNVGIPKNQWD